MIIFGAALRFHSVSRCLLVALSLLANGSAAEPRFVDESELVERVAALIDQRLHLMPEVAAIKFQQRRAISDPAREQEVIAQSVAEARALHLDAEAAATFFTLQIALARKVQEELHARWQLGSAQPPPARDLAAVLRPALDALGRELLPAVFLASSTLITLPAGELETKLARLQHHPGLTRADIAELARVLATVRIAAAPSWASLQRIGVLRVGTTGDYAPFSDDRGGGLRGLDIELVQDLARTWGLRVIFVRTSWPTLMADLAARRFDLAASGISITTERRRSADFSAAYHFDGKTPIARRVDASRFSSLEAIDQPGVRVIVNPGGTNERFVREHVRRATIILHPDNRTIFAEILARRADVMITDGAEVRLQELRHPELRGTMSEPFTRTGKAILLPQNSELRGRVDAWLEPQIARGAVAQQLSEALREEGAMAVPAR